MAVRNRAPGGTVEAQGRRHGLPGAEGREAEEERAPHGQHRGPTPGSRRGGWREVVRVRGECAFDYVPWQGNYNTQEIDNE